MFHTLSLGQLTKSDWKSKKEQKLLQQNTFFHAAPWSNVRLNAMQKHHYIFFADLQENWRSFVCTAK